MTVHCNEKIQFADIIQVGDQTAEAMLDTTKVVVRQLGETISSLLQLQSITTQMKQGC
jgi:hypothetical protein